jgi:hypothetical protein
MRQLFLNRSGHSTLGYARCTSIDDEPSCATSLPFGHGELLKTLPHDGRDTHDETVVPKPVQLAFGDNF